MDAFTRNYLKKRRKVDEQDASQEASPDYDSGGDSFVDDYLEKKRQENEANIKRQEQQRETARAVVEAQANKQETKKRGFWEAFGDKFEANSPEDKKKRIEKGEPELYKDQPTKGYSSIGNRIGDVFEANSPQDKAKRLAIGQKETHQEQKAVEKEAKQRAEKLQFKPEELDARRDYYDRAGINIDKAIDLHTRYGEVLNKDLKAKDRDWKAIAEKARAEGLFDGKEDATKDLEDAYQFERQNSKVTPAIFRQAVAKAISSDYDPEKLKRTETDYSDYAATLEPEGAAQQFNRAAQRGLVEQIVKFPRSAQTMGAGLIDLVSPEGSRADKFAQKKYEEGKEGLKYVDEKLTDQGVGQSKYDNQVIANLGGGAGSLTSSILMAGLAGGGNATKATSWFGKAKAALNPGVAGTVFGTNAGAEQYIGAIDNGKADWQAYGTAMVAGAAEGYLEKLGLDKFMGAKGSTVKKFVTRSLSEGGQEASQSFAQAGVKSTYTSVDMSDAIMQAIEEGGYGAVIGGGGGLALSLAENMKAKGVPPEVADATAEKVAAKISKAAEEELPEADGDTIAKELNGTQGTVQVPTDGDEIVKELQGGVVAPNATGEAVDGQPLPEDGDTIVKELQGNGEPMVNQVPNALPQNPDGTTKLPTTGDDIVKELQDVWFHGTGEGVSFDKFDVSKAQQGNRGKQIYLTESQAAADWFSKLKSQANFMKTDAFKNGTENGAIGDFTPNTLQFAIPKDSKIKVLDKLPQQNAEAVIEQLKKEGYDGVRFTDDVLDTIEGQPELANAYKNGKHPDTLIMFDPEKLQRVTGTTTRNVGDTKDVRQKGSLKKLDKKTDIEPPQEGYTRYEVVVDGQKIYADYNPNSMAGQTHVEFHGAKNNPISATGYKSHFTGEKIQEGNEQKALQDLADFFAKDNKKTYDAGKKKGAVKPLGKNKAQTNITDEKTIIQMYESSHQTKSKEGLQTWLETNKHMQDYNYGSGQFSVGLDDSGIKKLVDSYGQQKEQSLAEKYMQKEIYLNYNGEKGTVVGEQDIYILVKPEFGTGTAMYTKEGFERIISKQSEFAADAKKTEVRQAEAAKQEQAQQQEAEAVKKRREALLDYSGTTPMQRGKIDKMLSKKVNVWGQEGTLEEVIAAHNPTNKYKVGGEYVIDATDGVNSGVMHLPKMVWDRLKVPEMSRDAFGEKTPVASVTPQVGKPTPRQSSIEPTSNNSNIVTRIELDGRKYDMTEEQLLSRLFDEQSTPKAERSINQQDKINRITQALKDLQSDTSAQVGKTEPNKNSKIDFEVRYPEGKDLPENLKERMPIDDKGALKADNKLTPREVEIVTSRTIGWNKTQLRELIKNSKDLKENPVLTVVAVSKDTRYSDYRNSNLAIEYKSKDGSQMFRLPIDEIGFSRERVAASGIKAGDTISINEVLVAKGKVPVLRNTRSGVDYHAGTDNRTVDNMGASDVARSPEELVEIINQLNRAGQKSGILRKGGLKSKKAAGLHAAVRRAEWQQGKLGTVKLRDDVLKNPSSYMTVLAHELSHAIEFAVNGTTGKTLELFGDLTAEEKKTITAELKEIVNNIEGADLAATDPSYFYKPTEMLARYVETLLLSPGGATDAKGNITNTVAKQLAPVTTEKFEQAIVRHSAIGDLIEAVNGTLKDKSKIHAPNWWLDMRQIYQKHLGKQVGSIAYGAEVVRRAKMQRWQQSVGVFIKEKFKDVKDKPAQLFRVAEAIKQTDPDGNIVYGTRDFAKAENQKEIKEMTKLGWEFVRVEQDRNGNDVALMAKQRYTEEQGKAMFAALSPEGQQLIRDYVARKENAKDTFNREYIKEVYNIDGNIEGWVHRGLRAKEGLKGRIKNRTTLGGKKGSLREKKAGTRKQRTAEGGHLEDLQKQLEKVLREVGDEKINNDFIEKQLARISKPLASGEEPDSGWVEVFYDKKKGIMLPGEGGRDKVTIEIQETEEIPEGFMSMSKPETVSKVTFLKPIVRLQVPAPLAEHYRNIRQVPQEISRAQKIMTNLSKYWAINVLTHGGTVGTNFIGGGIQYSAKILEDFYVELATGKVTMPQTRRNVAAMVQVLTPRGWSSAPDYIYGGVRSSYAGQFMNKSKTETLLDKAGDIALTPMGMVESYWKKAVIIADQANTIPKQKLEKEMLSFSKSEEEMITAVNEEIDKVAYDYDNAPMWLDNWGRKGGLVKPFMKYPYKYAKQVTGLATGAFDRDLPLEVRIAKLMTLTTLVALSSALTSWRDDDKETPDGSDKTPSGLNPRGRLFLWKNGAEEMFVRTAKYPFVNITSIGKSMLQGDFDEARTAITDQLGTVGVGADLALILMGRPSEYEQYTPIGAQIGKRVATFIPGFRVLNDIGRAIDDKPRKQETFVQGIMSNLPVWWGGEETKSELRGDPRTIKIPVEPEGTRKKGDTETIEKDMKTYKSDLLLSALTGIYITRINPSDAKQQALREKRNAAEKRIEALLTDGKTQEANDVAAEAGLTIPKGTFDYYRRLREKRN